MYQHSNPRVNVTAGNASVPAVDLTTQCGEVDFQYQVLLPESFNPEISQSWPTYVEIIPDQSTRGLEYSDLAIWDTFPWYDCEFASAEEFYDGGNDIDSQRGTLTLWVSRRKFDQMGI